MTRTLNLAAVLTAVAALLAGCPSDGEKENLLPAVSGTFDLVSIDGQPVPYSPMHGSNRAPEVAGGSMTINSDGTFAHVMKFSDSRVGNNGRHEQHGTYTKKDDALLLKWTGAGYTKVTIEGDKLTMNNEGMLFVYQRQKEEPKPPSGK